MAENKIEFTPDAHPIGVAKQPFDAATEPKRAAVTGEPVPPGAGTPEPRALVTWDGLAALSADPAHAREAAVAPPDDVAASIQRLPQWQAHYVLSLMEYGGIAALARQRCSVSFYSVNKAQRASPEFVAACALAVSRSADWEDAAIWRDASGNATPIYQKGIVVGYKPQRSAEAAELFLRLRGRLGNDGNAPSKPQRARPAVAAAQVPGIVAATLATLFATRAAQQMRQSESR